MAQQVSRKALASVGAATGLLGYTWYTIPDPYPPRTWSIQARAFPDRIAMGLGPFQYYFPEMGAVADASSCLKPGIDDPAAVGLSGLRMMRAEDYDTFESSHLKKLRERLMHKPRKTIAYTPSVKIDVPVTVSIKRNVKGKPFNSVISFEERREIEKIVVDAIHGAQYYAFPGSKSWTSSMSLAVSDLLRSRGLIFEPPWTTYDLSCGYGRHWPDARGVVMVPSGEPNIDTAVWVNGEDHIEVIAVAIDGDVSGATLAASSLVATIEKKIDCMHSPLNGYLTMKPDEAGTGLKISSVLILERLCHHPLFPKLCSKIGIATNVIDKQHGVVNVASYERFGLTVIELATQTQRALATVIEIESLLTGRDITKGEDLIETIVYS